MKSEYTIQQQEAEVAQVGESNHAMEGKHKQEFGFVVLDGSVLEGGGQILRNSCAYSALLKQPIRIKNIRAGRTPKPGLRAQHLTGIELVHSMVGGKLTGGEVGSLDISFSPGNGAFLQVRAIGTAPLS